MTLGYHRHLQGFTANGAKTLGGKTDVRVWSWLLQKLRRPDPFPKGSSRRFFGSNAYVDIDEMSSTDDGHGIGASEVGTRRFG
jgi:hypothetical protein